MKKVRKIAFLLLGIVAGMYVGYNLVLGYIDSNKMWVSVYGKAPKDHGDYGYAMQYRLSPAKYRKIYRYKAEGSLPSSFNENTYLSENPEDAVYIANVSGKDGDPWLLIFSDKMPQGHGLVYKKK